MKFNVNGLLPYFDKISSTFSLPETFNHSKLFNIVKSMEILVLSIYFYLNSVSFLSLVTGPNDLSFLTNLFKQHVIQQVILYFTQMNPLIRRIYLDFQKSVLFCLNQGKHTNFCIRYQGKHANFSLHIQFINDFSDALHPRSSFDSDLQHLIK